MSLDAKDIKSSPSKGRFFPLRYSEVLHEVKELGMKQDSGQRIAVQMKNPKAKGVIEENWPLAELGVLNDVMVFSVPESFDEETVSKALREVLGNFALLNKIELKELPTCGQFYQARLKDQSTVEYVHIIDHFKSKAYFKERRGKTNSFKCIRTELKPFVIQNGKIQYHACPKQLFK
jgi:hypothetical protein